MSSPWLRFLSRKLLYAFAVLIGINLATFALFFQVSSPDDMARLQLGGKRVTPDAIAKWKAERGYDRPLYYNDRAEGIARLTDTLFVDSSLRMFLFDFGRADSGRDIAHEIKRRAGPSLALAVPSFVVGLGLSIIFALGLAFFRASYLDFWGSVLCVVLMSISSLFFIVAGQFLFSRLMQLLPVSGFSHGTDAWRFLLLPILIAIVARLGSETRFHRSIFLEEIGKDYVRTARAKGLGEATVLFVHVLRNAMIPIVTGFPAAFVAAFFTGALLIETLFSLDGLGLLSYEAVIKRDYPVVMGTLFFFSVLGLLAKLVNDVLYVFVDPRVQFEASRA